MVSAALGGTFSCICGGREDCWSLLPLGCTGVSKVSAGSNNEVLCTHVESEDQGSGSSALLIKHCAPPLVWLYLKIILSR